MQKICLSILVSLLIWSRVSGGIHETLPTFHWAYDYIDELRLNGYFEDFYILNRPFTRGQIADYLIKIKARVATGEVAPTRTEKWLLDQLYTEFNPEMQRITAAGDENQVSLGSYAILETDHREAQTVGHLQLRTKFNLSIADKIELYNGVVFDNRLDEDPTYIGKRQGDMVSFTEQAYVTTTFKNFNFKFGRDFIRFGAGRSGTLMFSDFARPLDQFWASYSHDFFKFSFFVANLDPMMVPDSTTGAMVRANRFLSAHRIDFKLFDRVYLGITESVIYGGPHGNWELEFLNPFMFYHLSQINGPVTGNTFGSVDFAIYPVDRLSFFGEFLIDDIQLEHSKIADLEPNELGLIIGLQAADFLGISGTQFWGEYARVTNRTYNTLSPWEKFLHRQQPIGYFLGNDFDRWQVNLSQWLVKGVQMSAGFERTRRGEGRVQNEFDMPWVNSTVEQGYSEPFPTGIVETTQAGNFGVVYQPSAHLRFNFFGQVLDVTNLENQLNRNNTEFRFILGLWYEGDLRFTF